jgi:signal transduction histidine kinase
VAAHDRTALDPARLQREIGPAARLAIENERLQAEVLAQLDDLRASRARIVEAADTERRRLERDLHDGAQQRLLALSYDIRLAGAAAENAGHAATAALLVQARDDVQAGVDKLRELAHGIYPAILTEAGLGPALRSLADTADVPVRVEATPDERFPAAVERTAYLVVAETLQHAARLGVSTVAVQVARSAADLTVDVRGLEPPRLPDLADRVAALGGQLTGTDTTLRVELSCG